MAGLLAVACAAPDGSAGAARAEGSAAATAGAGTGAEVEAEEVELAILMSRLQVHTDKLGYSVQARNRPLAGFYLAEIEETYEELAAIPEHDGYPVAHPAGVILAPLLERLQGELAAGEWSAAADGYAALVDGCNRCHAATEHEYVVILPVSGPPPYSQRFEPAD